MTVRLTATGIEYPDGTVQTQRFDSNDDSGGLIQIDTYTGNNTWYKPTGARQIRVLVIGGGGGGCGHTESGGAGGFAEKWIDVSSWSNGQAVSITCGSAGDGRNYHQGCGTGGTSSFGSYVSASGGQGANTNWGHSGGHGGIGSGGDINLWGGGGHGHENEAASQGATGYFGGGSFGNHHSYRPHYAEGTNHNAPGAGGAGNWITNHGRGAYGSDGAVVVYSYK